VAGPKREDNIRKGSWGKLFLQVEKRKAEKGYFCKIAIRLPF